MKLNDPRLLLSHVPWLPVQNVVLTIVACVSMVSVPLSAQSLDVNRGYRLQVPSDTAFGDEAYLDAKRSGASQIFGDNRGDLKFAYVARLKLDQAFAAAINLNPTATLTFTTGEYNDGGQPASPARVWLLNNNGTERDEATAAAMPEPFKMGEFPIQANTEQSFVFDLSKLDRSTWERDDWIVIGIENDTTFNNRDDIMELDEDSIKLTAGGELPTPTPPAEPQ